MDSVPVILRLSVADYDKLVTLGALFGAHVLKPLIARGNAPVVASYGPAESGKSTLMRNAVKQLPDFFAKHARDIPNPRAESIDDVTPAEGAFRYQDFGPGTIGERMMNEDIGFLPRKDMARIDPRYAAGVDVLEHPPIWHLEDADVVVLSRLNFYIDEMKGQPKFYFVKTMASAIAGYRVEDEKTFHGFFQCRHPETPRIIAEMQRMGNVECIWQGEEARRVTFILGNQRPEFREAFSNFVKAAGCG